MKQNLQFVILLLVFSVCRSVDIATKLDPEKVCLLPQDVGKCYRDLFTMWFYDSKIHICREFLYGGCDGNENRFKSEEDCYAVCKERLVLLHPPKDVTVGYTQHNTIFIYWYRPENYKLHVANDTATGKPITAAVTVTPIISSSTGSVTNTSDKTKLTNATVTADLKGSTTQSSVNQINATAVNSDTKISSTNVSQTNSQKTAGAATNVSKDGESDNSGPDIDWTVALEGGVNLKLSDYIGRNPVPFHFAKLKHYILSYGIQGKPFTNMTILGNKTEAKITGLVPSSDYRIILTAVYLTNSSVAAQAITAQTRKDPSEAKDCHCDIHGTVGGNLTCKLSLTQLPWCRCKPGYSGLFCEICDRGYYRTTPSLPCHICPCDEISSTKSCFFVDSYLHCSECKQEYAGQHCQRCANGYHRDIKTSLCKKCEGCHSILPGLICDPFSGQCLNCHYNTTGHKCERCLEGFEGDPSKNISCISIKDKSGFKPPPAGLIAAIIIGIIISLSIIIGCIVYYRMRSHPAMKPFWTVELKQDHESVNFSSVPDNDWENLRDDELFQEKQSKNKSKSQPYSQLREEN